MACITVRKQTALLRSNVKFACSLWAPISTTSKKRLREMTIKYGFSIARGDICLLEGAWYVTHVGLLGLSSRRRCRGIRTSLVNRFSDPLAGRWVFKATVYTTAGSRGFVGHGDADPSNVSPLVRGAEMRMAETRAVNRALRKAYGIGL